MVELVAAMGGGDCEAWRGEWLAQPANAVSSLAYVVAGAGVLWTRRRAGGRGRAALAGAGGMMAAGIGSFAYHGPQPGWAGVVHDGAIVGLLLAVAAHALAALRQHRPLRRGLGALVVTWRPAGAWMVPASAGYLTGRTESPLCDPMTLWQPHAAWHVLGAVALAWFFTR